MNWRFDLKNRSLSIEEVLENWDSIVSDVDVYRAKDNYNNWMQTKSGWKNPKFAGQNRNNYYFYDYVNLDLNPWAKWENMPDSIKLLIEINNIHHIFKN
jgi:hypothetical protein